MDFIHENFRIYVLDDTGQLVADVTFPAIDQKTVNINHTYVHPSLRGQGVADKLIREAIADIQSRGLKTETTCSYAKKWFTAHKEFSNILAD